MDLHKTYKDLVSRENSVRPRDRQLNGMTYCSFIKVMKFAQLLDLVELVREEPMLFPPPADRLYRINLTPKGDPEVVLSRRRVFKLSNVGAADEKCWTNLCRAWIEMWPRPQKIAYAPPYVPPVEAPPVIEKPVVRKEWSAFKKVSRYSAHQTARLGKHVEKLSLEGITPRVKAELERLGGMVADWAVEAEDDAIKADKGKKPEVVGFYRKLLKLLNSLEMAFLDAKLEDIKTLIKEIEDLGKK